ncbi:MarR family transcriptional regulator [Virgibacillus dakarensis]|uniref:MarR family transcriptional regulator n=1 Tax=Virgibacillus dakarensis TaxID=1917889 RepID=UPI00389A71E2
MYYELTSADYKTLFFLCEEMNHDNNITYIKQKQLAEHLEMNKGNISRSIKKLREKQFIVKCENGFMINLHLFYVGRRGLQMRFELRDRFD